jgi:hypothetical protein
VQLYLQFGHGMMDHALKLLTEWGGGGAILSPRDLDDGQLRTIGPKITKLNAEVLLDPQCFLRDADHYRLTQHQYWTNYKSYSTADLASGTGARALLGVLASLNDDIGAGRFILPGLLADPVTEEWFAFHEQMVTEGVALRGGERTLATVALSEAVVRNEDQIEAVVDRVAKWPCAGVYLICETPGSYLVDDPVWLANVLILASGLRLAGRDVLVGYCHHQMLALAAAKVDAIASGTWLNVRAFPPEKFYTRDEDEQSRRTTWYYCPQALSEYKLPFLDIAQRNSVLDEMQADPALGSAYADPLFHGPAPSTIKWGEQNAFRHYLTCLRSQCLGATCSTYNETLALHQAQLGASEALLKRLKKAGVSGQDRDFTDYVAVNRGALITFDRARGARLRRQW